MTELDIADELLFAGMGLSANAYNKQFNPKPETVFGWSVLMHRAYKRIRELEGQVQASDKIVSETLATSRLFNQGVGLDGIQRNAEDRAADAPTSKSCRDGTDR
jgi:hypothetical protein